MIRSPLFPIIVGLPAIVSIAWMVAPHITRGFRDSRSRRLTGDALVELRDWWQRQCNPRPVAAFGHPDENESLWLTTVPMEHLRRLARSLRRQYRAGRLHGQNITATRAVRRELWRRLEAADRPNRAVMDHLSDGERGFIRQHLNVKETK